MSNHAFKAAVERPGKEILSLSRIVLGLQRIVHDVLRPDRHSIVRIRFLVLYRVCVIYIPSIVLIRSGHETEKGIILDDPLRHLYGIFHSVMTKTVDIVPGCGDADHQLICVGLHSLFESVVLRRQKYKIRRRFPIRYQQDNYLL